MIGDKIKQNRNLLIVGIICLVALVGIVGYTYSFFQVKDTDTGSIVGTVASTSLELEVEKLVPSTNVGLVPQLDEYITSAVVGKNNKNCVDDNGNEVCQVYSITVTNTSSVTVNVDGLVELNAGNNPNLKWAEITGYTLNMTTNPTLASDYNLHTFKNLTTNEEYAPSEEKTYYIVVWISEINEEQNDTGTFSGTVTFKLHEEEPSYQKIDNSGANAPGYVEGLIPVMYDESTSRWVKADTKSSTSQYGWYDYDAKKWANAVLVKENTYIEKLEETNKSVNILNDLTQDYVYTSSNKGIQSSTSESIFTFKTGESGGIFSFDYSVVSRPEDTLTITLNGTTIVDSISREVVHTYTGVLEPNTEYTLIATYTKTSPSTGYDDQGIISNIELPNGLANPLNVTASGNYGWTTTTEDVYSIKTYSSYKINDDGNYVLENKNRVSATDAIEKYICSDASSDECSIMYQIKGASGNNITSVDVYTTESFVGKRTEYKNASAGTPITESDILAYYVWIPRYKYKVWNINKEIGVDTYDAYTKGIDIVFEEKDASTGTITCNYSFEKNTTSQQQPAVIGEICSDVADGVAYYTHPAFTFGNDELDGFWMGKFELSSTDQIVANYGGGNRIDLEPRILPDVISWRKNSIDNFWKVIYDMQKVNNIYGLPTERIETDSHLITNMEWGAVAYLTHSKYGKCTGGENSTCTEVVRNGSGETAFYTNYTGRSSTPVLSYIPQGYDSYNMSGNLNPSTSGNIYGIFDMSGGASEYVMGNSSTGEGYNNSKYIYSVAGAGTNYTFEGFEKYLTTYSFSHTYYTSSRISMARLGDSTGEIVLSSSSSGKNLGWYDDSADLPFYQVPWVARGGAFSDIISAGIFNYYRVYGSATDGYLSTRAVLASIVS